MEPTFVALGSTHVALGMNNHVSFHLLSPDGCVHVATREYVGTVEAIKLNGDFVGVLTEGRVCLDSLDAAGDGGGIGAVSRVFPEGGHQAPRDVTCLAMTKEFLIYGTQRGVITVVYLPEMSVVAEFRHEGAIVDVFPNALGTRVAFVDASRSAFLLSPVDDSVLPLPRLPPNLKGILWDRVDPGVVMAYGASSYGVYLYLPHSVSGASVAPISPELVPYPTASLSPILLSGGVATCQEPSGAITPLVLPTHQALHSLEQRGGATPDKVRKCFGQALEVGRLQAAWELATRLKEKALFSALGEAALRQLDINLATRVYRQLGDAGMVMALRKLEGSRTRTSSRDTSRSSSTTTPARRRTSSSRRGRSPRSRCGATSSTGSRRSTSPRRSRRSRCRPSRASTRSSSSSRSSTTRRSPTTPRGSAARPRRRACRGAATRRTSGSAARGSPR